MLLDTDSAQSDQTAFSSEFNSDLLAISAWTLKSLLRWDINCLPLYTGLFSPSSCWSCSSQILQGMYLILMFQPVLFHWCQRTGKSPSQLEHLPTLRSIANLLPEVSLTCCPKISEAIAVSLTCRFPLLRGCSSAFSTAVTFLV